MLKALVLIAIGIAAFVAPSSATSGMGTVIGLIFLGLGAIVLWRWINTFGRN